MNRYRYIRHIAVWTAVVLLTAVGGCSSTHVDEPDPVNKKNPVTFKAVSADSRAAASNAVFEKPGTAFRVWGVFYDPTKAGVVQVFDGREVTRTEDGWTYDKEEYWMPGFTYDFRALYPADLADGSSAHFNVGNGATSSLSVTGFVADGTDLMAASDRKMVLSDEEVPAFVDLKFRHLLCRVNFFGKTDDRYLGADGKPDDGLRGINILSLKVSGIADRGNWNGASYKADGFSYGEWEAVGAAGEYVAVIPEGGIALGNTPTGFFSGDNAILAIPQTFTELLVDIDYEYTRGDLGVQHAVARISGAWLPGKSYSYSFSINTHIFFDTPTVDDWISAPINNGDFDIILP